MCCDGIGFGGQSYQSRSRRAFGWLLGFRIKLIRIIYLILVSVVALFLMFGGCFSFGIFKDPSCVRMRMGKQGRGVKVLGFGVVVMNFMPIIARLIRQLILFTISYF